MGAVGIIRPLMRILISNDDGVRAPGIAMVAQTLQAIGNVINTAAKNDHRG